MTNNPHRCGWCIDGKHAQCAVVIELKPKAHTLYHCPCQCNTTGKYTPLNPRVRCLRCGRRDVEVTAQFECADRLDCDGYIEHRRQHNPTYQAMAKLRDGNTDLAEPVEKHTRPAPKPKVQAQCLCCGEPTKGGQFLPGHDARYVSLQAEQVIAGTAHLTDLEAKLSHHLYNKLLKRTATLQEKAKKELQPA